MGALWEPQSGPHTALIPQGNLVNFLRTRGRALVPLPQLLQFSL